MKKILPIFALMAFLWACNDTTKTADNAGKEKTGEVAKANASEAKTEEKAEANAELPDPDATGTFGAPVSAEGAVAAAELPTYLDGQDSVRVTLKGNISSCCQAKGCWMTMPIVEGQDLMVKFKDYGFFVPKNSSGKEAVIDGWAYREVVSVAELRHFAEDAGKSADEIAAITEEEERITFLADGVLIE